MSDQDQRVQVGGLDVATSLHRFVEDEALPGTGLDPQQFWDGVGAIVRDLAPRNRELLARRDELQSRLDDWHREHPGTPDQEAYTAFLREIGYLLDEPDEVAVTTSGVDDEVARIAGPQLVVPLLNARFATNAVNARWGSLYDALYGTDVISHEGDLAPGQDYNKVRGDEVIKRGRAFLDEHFPLASGSHADATAYAVDDEGAATTVDGEVVRLADPSQFVGFRGPKESPEAVLLAHHQLHVEIQVDPEHPIGSTDAAGVKDLLLESAVSTIMDLEDSVAAVDADDKVLGYRNWLRLMDGTLAEEVTKGGKTFTRSMNPDRVYTTVSGDEVTLRGRSLLFIRQVGHLMTTDAVLDGDGQEVPEGILDAVMTALGSVKGLRGEAELANSATGSMYVVKPKMHGPDEVAFAVELFGRVEELLGLTPADDQGRHHGRGAAYDAQPQGLHRPGPRAGRVHQHRLPGPHRRRDPHLDAGRPGRAQGRHEGRDLDRGLRGPQRRHRPGVRPARPRPDRQGHVGRARQPRRHARGQDRPPAGRCQLRLGALADRRHRARAALPPGRRPRPSGGAAGGRPSPRSRGPPPGAAGRPRRLVRRGPPGRDRQQPAEPPGLRRPLGRRRGGLLQGARHHR